MPASTMPASVTSASAERAAPEEAPDPMRVWFRFVRLNRRVTGAMAGVLRGLGLSIPQFDLISTLGEREGLTQQDLAQRLYVTKGNVSGLVDRLVEAGLVERRPLAGDRRSHALHLTDEGRRLAAAGLDAQAAYVARTLGRLPDADLAALERVVLAWREEARREGAAREGATREGATRDGVEEARG